MTHSIVLPGVRAAIDDYIKAHGLNIKLLAARLHVTTTALR